jgi:hypothetical protein
VKILRPEEVTDYSQLITRDLTPEELAEAYALARAAFTAADLQEYTEVDDVIPAEDVVHEMEEAQKQFDEKKQ